MQHLATQLNMNTTLMYTAHRLVPRPIPSLSMLHAEKREGLVREVKGQYMYMYRYLMLEKIMQLNIH